MRYPLLIRTTLFFYVAGVCVSVAQTQTGPGVGRNPDQPILTVREVIGLGRNAQIKAPEYKSNASRMQGEDVKWVCARVVYDSYPEWIDELTFSFHLLGMTEKDGRQSFSLYKLSVKYSDIRQGRRHVGSAYLRPSAVERYGQVIALAVEIAHEGKVIAEHSLKDSAAERLKLPDDWWKNDVVIKSDKVTERPEYLVSHDRSPFALLNLDRYEYIR